MSALIAFFLSNPTILAIMGGILGALGWGFHQRRAGVKAERAKQAQAEAKARDIKDQVQNDIGALPAGQAREELRKWSK